MPGKRSRTRKTYDQVDLSSEKQRMDDDIDSNFLNEPLHPGLGPYLPQSAICCLKRNSNGTFLINPQSVGQAEDVRFHSMNNRGNRKMRKLSDARDILLDRRQHENRAFGADPHGDGSPAPASNLYYISKSGDIDVTVGVGIPTEAELQQMWRETVTVTAEGTVTSRYLPVETNANVVLPPRDSEKVDDLVLTSVGSKGAFGLEKQTLAGSKSRARLLVVNDTGNVKFNLLEIHKACSVHLDICSKTGNVTVFLPRTFHGQIQLNVADRSKRGSIAILPALAAHWKVMQKSRQGMTLSSKDLDVRKVTEEKVSQRPSVQVEDHDLCVIHTDTGEITIGLLGYDSAKPAPNPSRVIRSLRKFCCL